MLDFIKNKYFIILLSCVACGVVGYVSYYFLGPDNPIEESCEKVIQDETGMVVDLSPSTAEVK